MKYRIFLLNFLFLAALALPYTAAGQAAGASDKRTVKGVVLDEVDRTPLIGATVLV